MLFGTDADLHILRRRWKQLGADTHNTAATNVPTTAPPTTTAAGNDRVYRRGHVSRIHVRIPERNPARQQRRLPE